MEEKDAVGLLWNEWAYRHDLFWKSLFRWGAAVIALWIVPFVKPEIVSKLGHGILIFPSLALLLSLAAAWHLGAEYSRLKVVNEKYRSLLGNYRPGDLSKDKWWMNLFGLSIGTTAVLLFGLLLSVFSICIALWLYLNPIG